MCIYVSFMLLVRVMLFIIYCECGFIGMGDIVSEYMCGRIISIGDGRVRESDEFI